jgi:hypothetical protein
MGTGGDTGWASPVITTGKPTGILIDPFLYHVFCTKIKWYKFYGTFFVPNILYQKNMVQISWYKYICLMKRESFVQDLLDFLRIGHKEMAEFFNISRQMFNKSALGTRKFPFHLNQRRLDMLNLMARMKAEKANQPEENPTGFSPSFKQSRLDRVENRIRILNEQLTKMSNNSKSYRNALEFYERMKTEFPDLTPLDLAWIQKETDKITPHLSDDQGIEQKLWELKMLQMELKELK